MADLHRDHLRILELTRAALQARDDRSLWRQNPGRAAEEHGFFCDALWTELERQVNELEGKIPVLEHPSVHQRRMIASIRREIVTTAQAAIEDALDELANGPMIEDYGP